MTTSEQRVAVVTDSGCSIRPEDDLAKKYDVTIVPLKIKFYENGLFVPYRDLDIEPEDFYQRMRESAELPQTSGAVPGRIAEIYGKLSKRTNSIVSIHLTSVHSAAFGSADLGREDIQEKTPELLIEVIDSRQISLGMWFLAEKAAKLSQEGANLEEIKMEVLATIPKIELLATLSTLSNIIRGGRVPALHGYLGTLLRIKPILGVVDGKIEEVGRARTISKARKEMVSRVMGEDEIVKMAVLHTNDFEAAYDLKEALSEFYFGDILVRDAGPVLGVHAGERAVGIVFQRA